MSQMGPSATPSTLTEGLPISSLTLLILLLIPCVVLLLLLNCMILGYKLLVLYKRKRRRRRLSSESTLLQSTLSTRQRVTKISGIPSFSNKNEKRNFISISEPMLAQPVSSSLTSSKERAATGQRIRILRPDGATGGAIESLAAPSTILATMSTTGSTTRADLPRRSRLYTKSSSGWRRSAPVLLQSSDSDTDRPNTVPPNSPELNAPQSVGTSNLGPMRRSSTMELQDEMKNMGVNSLDTVKLEYEYASSIPQESSCFVASANSSIVGPGLDSDFGASAGISLRILSSDSDGFTNAILGSGLEWDYYDPCYVRQNHVPKHMHHMPTVTTKQYWV
ncbi:protein huluwa [Megalops cyprinoides]|uniref:protein huluwa n=1 Tax=Megalops cyprinoides TaxID=118141 RepID=UPI0018644FA6|nr:protein huluwa [Megalops cyprinoides]